MIFSSPLPPVEVPAMPLTPFVLARVAEFADKVAFIDGSSGATTTYGQFEQAVRAQAGGWLAAGLRPGEVIAIMAPNCPEYAVAFHAIALAGGVVTTINPTYTEREVAHQLKDAGATRLVVHALFGATAAAAAEGTGVIERYSIGDAEGYTPLSSIAGEPLQEQVGGAPDDLVVLPYSSGTTGLSKGVMLSHHNLVANIVQGLEVLDFTPDDAYVAVLPFFHIYGMQVLMNMGLTVGATLVTMPRFDLPQFLQLHQDHQLTRAFVAPPMVVALAKHPIVEQYDLGALKTIFSGAAPLSGRARRRVRRPPRLRGDPGLRHDRAVTDQPHHPARTVQARLGRRHRPAHRDPGRRPRDRRGRRRRRCRRDLGARAAGDAGLPQQSGGHGGDDRRRRLAAHRRCRQGRRRRPRLHRRPAQGADQVQGLPGAAGRARSAAAHPSRCRRRRGHRHPRRRGRRDPGRVRRVRARAGRRRRKRCRRSSPSGWRATSRFGR